MRIHIHSSHVKLDNYNLIENAFADWRNSFYRAQAL